jgi:hypothetical protein
MSEIRPIPLVDILIDVENPRLPQPSVGQREAIRGIAVQQGPKLLAMARHIVQNGLNPAEHLYVMPLKPEEQRFVVLEGNRRLATLKGLENPDLLDGAIATSLLKEFHRLNKQYQQSPIESVSCIVFKSREEADPWIQLKHDGELEGAGIVRWGSDDKARYRARIGKTKQPVLEIQTQVLNFLENRGDLTAAERRRVPATSYKRLLETPRFREKMGIEFEDGRLAALADEDVVANALLYVAKALISRKVRTKDIYDLADRIKYANNLPADVVVIPTKSSGEGVALPTEMPGAKAKAKAGVKKAKPRDHLIPGDCVLSIGDARLADIERELRSLSLENTPNAVSVLFRVFIELSCDAYVIRAELPTLEKDVLGKKLQDVTKDLVKQKKLTPKQAEPVMRARAKDSFLCPSLTLMNQYIHNMNMAPSPTDLRAHWDSLQPFVIAVWAP